jgi:hypothetical protein
MNKNVRNGLIAVSTSMLMSGCGSTDGNASSAAPESSELPTAVKSAIDAPTTTLSQELTNTLSYMGNEERLAYDIYNKLYDEWGTKQFTNIANKSEVKHISAVQELVKKYKLNDNVNFTNVDLPALGYMNTPVNNMQAGRYDISKIQRLYDDLVAQGSTSEVDALKVGCIVEVVDVDDLDDYIKIAEDSKAQDIVTVFNFLRDGSYNHYWAFDKGLKNKGIAEGCCSAGSEYCHLEYPQNDNGKK